MFSIGIETLVLCFLLMGLACFMVLWLYYDKRDKTYYDRQRLRHVHHCVKCGNLYVSRKVQEPQPCPTCGFRNPALRF